MSGKRKRNRPPPKNPKPPLQTGRIKPTSKKPFANLLKWLGALLSVLVTASGVLPLFQSPSVQTPEPLGNGPLSLIFEVSNPSPLPHRFKENVPLPMA
jgi:hypothetical protein